MIQEKADRNPSCGLFVFLSGRLDKHDVSSKGMGEKWLRFALGELYQGVPHRQR